MIPRPDEEAGEVPKACVVLKPGARASADEIMTYVTGRVAPHKKIRQVEFIEQIPKSASGKILRRVLIERERATTAEEYGRAEHRDQQGSSENPLHRDKK